MSDKLNKALEFATNKHEGQLRKYTNEPYIVHPIAVMEKLQSLNFHEEVLIAALLHDTVEDTNTTIQEVEQNFGTLVARMVEDLTDVYTPEAYPKINRKNRKDLECYRLLKVQGNSKSIKLADLIDNTKSILKHDEGFAKTYLKEKENLLFVLEGGDQRLMFEAVESLLKAKKELGI